jgi:poly-gamma-glutamate synthesis protein (capsule biosynthesis protein)
VPRLACLLAAALAACSSARETRPTPADAPAEAPPGVAAAPVAAEHVPMASPPPAEPAPAPVTTPTPAAPAVREPLEMTFVGAIIFGRYREAGYDPIPGPDDKPFAEIAAQIRSDMLVGNLETPLVRELPDKSPIGAKYRFGASKQMAQHLVDGGFTAVSLANNHAFDQRLDGMVQSPLILRELGIVPLGAARTEEPLFRVETIERRGWKIGFFAVTTRRNAPQFDNTPILPFLSTTELDGTLGPLIAAAKADHDLVIVFIHWGDEYAEAPAIYQRSQAKALLDRGAHLVVGHHPHVLQGIERHGGGAVAYSLGNFLFENTNEIPRLTGVLRARFVDGGCLEALTFHPAYIKRTPTKHPVPATGAMGKVVRGRMRALSEGLGTTLADAGEDLALRDLPCPARAPSVM